jgi:transglutaminase-like putative cysteine protease
VRYVIEHETSLRFAPPVREHQCELRLTPRQDAMQRVHAVQIDVDPPAELFTYVDSFGNRVHHFSLIAPHDRLVTRLRTDVARPCWATRSTTHRSPRLRNRPGLRRYYAPNPISGALSCTVAR